MDVDYLGSAVFNRIRLRRAAIRRRRDKAGEERFVCWQNNVRQNDLGMELPGKDECIVDERKVVDYLLNVSRMPAAAKARFFFSCGFEAETWWESAEALKSHAQSNEVLNEVRSDYGMKTSERWICK